MYLNPINLLRIPPLSHIYSLATSLRFIHWCLSLPSPIKGMIPSSPISLVLPSSTVSNICMYMSIGRSDGSWVASQGSCP